jgi:putative transposase
MGRPLRAAAGGIIYHVLNRANGRQVMFDKPQDYQIWENVLLEAQEHVPVRILAYCAMPNHWHLVIFPRHDGDLSRFMAWLTLTHTQRWHAQHQSVGSGHLYQGRFKSFPVQSDEHFLTVCRYVEGNALRAKLVKRAESWQWSSLWRRTQGPKQSQWLNDWPMVRPRQWVKWTNELQTEEELETIRQCVQRGRPFGKESWVERMTRRLNLESTLRPRGRPKGKFQKGL